MNADRRKILKQALTQIEAGRFLLEQVRDEEQEGFENLSEGLQSSERGQKMEDAASRLEQLVSDLESCEGEVTDIAEGS